MATIKIKKRRVNINLPEDLIAWIENEAIKQGFTFTTMVQVMCMNYRKQEEAMVCLDKVKELETACKLKGLLDSDDTDNTLE